MIEIVKSKACAVTGHRNLGQDFSKNLLKEKLLEVINKGVDTFLVGMAIGFDSACFKVLEEIQQQKNIKIIACIPCENQDVNFTKEQKIEYRKMVNSAYEVVLISKNYTPSCMLKRNRFMVDNSEYLICYLRQDNGGTKYTVDYAQKLGKNIIRI